MIRRITRRQFLTRASLLGTSVIFGSALWPLRGEASRCEGLFRVARDGNWTEFSNPHRFRAAQSLVSLGLGQQGYVVRWTSLQASARGPFPERGEFLVSGVTKDQAQAWMDTIGKNSVGLVVSGLPERNPGTASLRVGNRYFTFSDIQSQSISDSGEFTNTIRNSAWGMSEITLPVSRGEQLLILDFIRARQEGRILARRNIRGGPQMGQPIRPAFDSHAFTLREESCAAACTSWFDPKWLAHYEGAEPLRAIAERLSLRPTYIAKQMLWGHVRQPGPIGLTLFGIDRDPTRVTVPSRASAPNFMTDFIGQNEWFKIRGMPAHGFIPDPISGRTGTIQSSRIPLHAYLSEGGGS